MLHLNRRESICSLTTLPPMSPQEIRQLLDSYTLRSRATRRQDGTSLFLAWYEEFPFLVAQGSGERQEAIAELELLAPTVVAQLVEDGIPLPEPQGQLATFTNRVQLNGIVVGAPPTIGRTESQALTSIDKLKGDVESGHLVEA